MKIILMAAVTIDGKIARHEHHFVDWSSKEDKKLFMQTSKRGGVVILGNNTYETFPSPLPGRLHIVLTTKVSDKPHKPGEIEFTDRSPAEIVAGLEARGYTEAVLTGGAQINALFLAANVVDEIWLTMEPHIFGVGLDLFRGVPFDRRATLLEVRQLNEGGSVLLRYGLDRSSETED
nr:RibD C-terminal domain protein [uncultured bacterium]AIA11632.1 RibD C-terminal domain protein [uncultured bacterium]